MNIFYFLLISILLGGNVIAQSSITYPYKAEFEQAYVAHPEIPRGVLEAVAWTRTHIRHISGNNQSCTEMPQVRGVMGFTENGKGYFQSTLDMASKFSGYSYHEIKTDPAKNIKAYAATYKKWLEHVETEDNWRTHEWVLGTISEIPHDEQAGNIYARKSYTYEILRFLNDPEKQEKFEFPEYNIDLQEIYGEENLKILSADKVLLSDETVTDESGREFDISSRTSEYGPALWVATPSCNYSSRSGTPISAVTIHTIQGTYSGAISWALNCDANVSYHYVVRSSDGQITQMLYEADKGWHVGSENPYTIGIEHEGYVDDPSWYTEAMYNASADLVKDITVSGYGINPLRTFQGPATAGLNTLGSCVKIKGHQHYPYQSHTDPGINWNWEHYYQLINDDPPLLTYATSSGTLYDSGGASGNYNDDERQLYLIQPAGAVDITLSFISFSLEENWDFMRIYDGNSLDDPLIGVYTGTDIPTTISSTGGSILLEFRSDCATTDSGWEINWSSVPGPAPGDVIAPSTSVSLSDDWYTADFTSTFTDWDDTAGTGVKHRFYQVIDWDGSEWRANSDHGFFSDNFNLALHPEWTGETGSWAAGGNLQQTDETLDNTNVWANLNQDDDDIWLYHWGMNIAGAGSNKRAGLHFMCDDPTLTNRGNSYFVWFRSDNDKIQIYKTISDVFYLEAEIPYTINDGQWYDIKTIYNKSEGLIEVWVDNEYAASWVDPSPYLTGNAISARTGNSNTQFENLKVYHNRSTSELITIGGPSAEVRYQNPDPLTPSCKVKSMVVDSSANISGIGSKFANVDWTAPLPISYINDGTAADIATTGTNTELSANWASTVDTHSDVSRYWYSIGTSPEAADVVDWTDNWYDTTVTHTGLELSDGVTYYICVYAENGAGLFSDTVCTDGQTVVVPTDPPVANFVVYGTNVCNTDSIQFENASTDAVSYNWSVPGATPSSSTDVNPYFYFPSSGTYEVTLTATGPGGTDVYVHEIVVESYGIPVSDFDQSEDIAPLSDAFITFTNNSENADGYFWNFGDGETSTDFEPWHEYTEVGIYDIMMIAINGTCPNDTSWSTVEITNSLDIAEEMNTDFTLWPNPATDFVLLDFRSILNEASDPLLEILDVWGKVIYRQDGLPTSGQLEIAMNDKWSDGLYIVRLSTTEATFERKLILNRDKR